MQTSNSFDDMVYSLSNIERTDLLKKIENILDPDRQTISSPESSDNQTGLLDLSEKLQTEPFLLKAYIWLLTFFTNERSEMLYNQHLLTSKAKQIEKKYPDLINHKKGLFLNNFYAMIKELKSVSDFFYPSITLYENNPGAFYVCLASFTLPDLYEKLVTESSPEVVFQSNTPHAELKNAQLRKIEAICNDISNENKNTLYSHICCIDWLRQFVHLPFHRITARFFTLDTVSFTCQMESLYSDLPLFASILCNGKKIYTEVLEALILFLSKDKIASEDLDILTFSQEQLEKSIDKIAIIKMFNLSVPLKDICSVLYKDYDWQPSAPSGIEDWFFSFKNYWRKNFELQWDVWEKQQKQSEAISNACSFFQISFPPLLENRPWLEMWCTLDFSYEYSLGFLFHFFQKKYPEYTQDLKILLIEGDFRSRENNLEFTDAYNELEHLCTNILSFNDKLSTKGEIGKMFTKIVNDFQRTIQGKSQFDSIMNILKMDAKTYIQKFCIAINLMISLLNGINTESHKSHYETLVNIETIQGKKNQVFRASLKRIYTEMNLALSIIKDFQTVETISP
ncbi:MAG: DUF5312 family protein [Treponemataceae bacterium]